MKGKVKCTCGWSWNKSDSSKKDMYICHECGRDNSNNMKNGGWLDQYADGGTMQEHQENYNDYKVSAPEGFKGTGYSNVGRNYSPAWGGQFQNGGKAPLYVKSKNDPRYIAYQDSLNLSDFSKLQNKTEPKIKGFISKDKRDAYAKTNNNKILKAKAEEIIKNNKNIEYINSDVSVDIRHKLNSPTYEGIFGNNFDDKFEPVSTWKGVGQNFNYAEPKQKVIVGKKPQQEVIVKPTTTKQTTKPNDRSKKRKPTEKEIKEWSEPGFKLNSVTDYVDPKTKKVKQSWYGDLTRNEQAIQNNLQPEGVKNDFNIDANLPVIRPDARVPKYYDVEDYTQGSANYINNQTNYRTSDLSTLSEQSPNNKRKITPRYQMGGNVYPVNYVPQAAMGASMPGAVGFTYARTKGIPSNGPYAKKTMASAKDGGWLDGYDEAQEGKRVLPNNRALQILADIQKRKQKGIPSPQFSNVKIKDERAEAVKKVDNTRTSSKPKFTDLKKTNVRNKTKAELAEQERINDEAILADRKARMADAMKAQDEDIIGNPNWKEVLARETQSTGDKFRLFPNDPNSFIDDWLNPGVMVGDMASSLGAAPYDMEQQESMMPLMTAIGVPLLTGGLEGIGAKTNRQFVNNLFNPVNMVPGYKSAEKYIGNKIGKIPTSISPELRQGMQTNGFLDMFKSKPNQPLQTIEEGIKPLSSNIKFSGPLKHNTEDIQNVLENLRTRGSEWDKAGIPGKDILHPDMIQYHGTYSGRPLVEVKMPDGTSEHFYKSSGWAGKEGSSPTGTTEGMWQVYGGHAKNNIGGNSLDNWFIKDGGYKNYYGSKTFADMAENMDKALMSKHNFKDVNELENVLNFQNRSSDIDSITPEILKKKQGGIIKDDMGQWDHPGEITEIGSNDITMEGVPYDVLGISDTGDTKLMKPGKNYKFKGKKVTEFPMAKNGLRQEQKGLVNLDNLLNFTNYNKPQPGGWLSKYE